MHPRRLCAAVVLLLVALSLGTPVAADCSALVVDAVAGSDSSCAPLVLTASTAANATILPCATLARAVALVDGPNYWLLLRPGVHSVYSLVAGAHSQLTISAEAPTVPTGSSFVIPAAATSGSVVWDCEGASHCIQLASTSTNVTFFGIEFVSVTSHAIVQGEATDGTSLSVTISACTFTGVGAVIKKDSGSLLFVNSIVQDGRTFSDAPDFDQTASMMQLNNTDLTMTGCTWQRNQFTGEYNTQRGGCVFVSGFLTSRVATVTVDSTIFRDNLHYNPSLLDNRATLGGMSINANGSALFVQVTNSQFVNNSQWGASNGLSIFVGQTPSSDPSVTVIVSSCVFSGNKKYYPPGADINLYNARVGGVISIWVQVPPTTNGPSFTCTDSIFENNDMVGSAGLVAWYPRLVLLTNLAFMNTTSTSYAAVYVTNRQQAADGEPWIFDRLSFVGGNTGVAYSSHAACRIDGVSLTLVVRDSNFTGNHGVQRGGGFHVSNGVVTFERVVFRSNVAIDGGGLSATASKVTLYNCEFSNNQAARIGGAIATHTTDLWMEDCAFSSNSLDDSLMPTTFLSEYPTSEGGAVRILAGSLTISSCTFNENWSLPPDKLSACSDYNGASDYPVNFLGGAICAIQSATTVTSSSFSGNAACSGGTAFISSTTNNIMFNDFSDSNAWTGGVFLFSSSVGVDMRSNTITTCSAMGSGGFLASYGSSTTSITSNTITDSTSYGGDGGALLFSGHAGKFNVYDNTFTDAVSPTGAGAVFFFQTQPNVVPLIIDTEDPEAPNSVIFSNTDVAHALYGEIEASNAVALSVSMAALTIYPGQAFASSSVGIVASTLDAYSPGSAWMVRSEKLTY